LRTTLVTNVESTAKPKTGTFDRLHEKLEKYSEDFRIEMRCCWRETVNSWVDSAPTETKRAYADMLAGWDLIRYLIDAAENSKRDSGLRDLVREVAAAQWQGDQWVKFTQVELDRERVADLFIDVTADRLHAPESTRTALPAARGLGGAASYLLRSSYPFTLVRGAPGQGKSTLGQYICQVHRTAFVPIRVGHLQLPEPAKPRFPVRFDLREYTDSLQGRDVFAPRPAHRSAEKARSATEGTIEWFLAEMMTHASGDSIVDAKAVQDLFDRVPALIVLDGLDEVGRGSSHYLRHRVVPTVTM
jgi:hypothetical protein